MIDCIIIIEMFCATKKTCKKIEKIINKCNGNVNIIVFTDKDEEILSQISTANKYNIINTINVINSELSKFDNDAYDEAKSLVDKFKKLESYTNYKEVFNSLYGNFYINYNKSSGYYNLIVSFIKNNINADFYVVGRDCRKRTFENIFTKSLVNYETLISFNVIKALNELNINFKMIKCKNILRRWFVNNIQPYIFNLGMAYFSPLVLLKYKYDNNSIITVLRSPTHIKHMSIFNQNSSRNYTNHDFIVLKKYKDHIINNDEYEEISLTPSIFNILSGIFDSKLRSEIKTFSNEHGLSWRYIYAACIINKNISEKIKLIVEKNKYDKYFCFEETNFYGALISYSIKSIIDKLVVIQHGITVHYAYTMPLISDERWVWGNQFKNMYIKLGEEPRKLKNISNRINKLIDLEKLNLSNEIEILIAPKKSSYIELVKWIKDIIHAVNMVEFVHISKVSISIHPNSKYSIDKFINALDKKYKVEIIKGVKTESIDKANIVFTGNTTVGYEAVLRGKRVIFYGEEKEIIYEYLNHSYIFKANKCGEIVKCIKNSLETSYAELKLVRDDYIKQCL